VAKKSDIIYKGINSMHVNVRYDKIVIITQLCVAYNKKCNLEPCNCSICFWGFGSKFFFWTNQV